MGDAISTFRVAYGKGKAHAMDAIGPATSEWVVNGADRYAATPEDALPALDVPGFRAHDPDVNVAVEKGACTQVVVHKARDGSYRLLLNGCESQAGADGYHVLPSFRAAGTIREDATGRQVPAPVVVSVLTEDGACAPQSAILQVKQRTYVAGVQSDEGREPVISQSYLRTTRPGDARSLTRVVAYPMRVGPPLTITFVDNTKARRVALDELAKSEQAWLDWLRGKNVDPKQATKELQKAAAKVRNYPLLGKIAGGAAVAAVLPGFLFPAVGALAALEASVGKSLGALASGAGWGAYRAARYMWAWKQMQRVDGQMKQKGAPREYALSAFNLPSTLQRVSGTVSGGIYSNRGKPLTLKDLRKAKRFDDAAVMEYLVYHAEIPSGTQGADGGNTAALRREFEAVWRFQQPVGSPARTGPLPDAAKKEIDDQVREVAGGVAIDGKDLGNAFAVQDVGKAAFDARGFVESVLVIEIVDAHRPGTAARETFRMRSAQSFEAGIVAAGYPELVSRMEEAVAQVNDKFTASADLASVPLVQQQVIYRKGTVTGNLKTDLMNWWVSRNQDVAMPPERELLAVLNAVLAERVLVALKQLVAQALPPPAPMQRVAVVRYLPHVVRMRNIGAPSFALDIEDSNVEMAEEDGMQAAQGSGLREAIAASRDVGRIVRQALSQFAESEGVARGRMRTQLLMGATRMDATRRGVTPIAQQPLKRGSGIDTRHVYAPRLPLAIVDAVACREQHAQLREQMHIAWLATPLRDPKGTGIAEAFRVPTTHVGELALGVIADLATDDVVRRVPSPGVCASPERQQLMASCVEHAVRQLQATEPLVRAAFRERPLPLRLDDNDAFFTCYPAGATLLKLLRESPAWRKWQEPRTDGWATRDHGWVQSMRESLAIAAPMGTAALRELLESIERLQGVVMPLDQFPFLSTQTLATQAACLPKAHDRAWVGLALQMEHAFLAAQRLHAMATGLGLDESHRAALLCDCVRARPVLACAPDGAALNEAPASCLPALALFTAPIAALRGPPLQPGVPSAPSAHTLLDNRLNHAVLQARTAAMRLDLDRLARERVLEDQAPLDEAFARLRVGAPVAQYLVPFGDATVRCHYPLVSCFFESLPVYVDLLLPNGAAPKEMVQGTIAPRRAHDPVDNLHPLVITTNAAAPPDLQLGVALANLFSVQSEATAPPKSLKEAHQQLAATSSGVGVDATSAFLFNVERLVQCVLLAAATSPDCTYLTAPPPSSAEGKRVEVPAAPAKPERLMLAEMRVVALRIFDSAVQDYQLDDLKGKMGGYNDSQVEPEKRREALLVELKYEESLYKWLKQAGGLVPAQQPQTNLYAYFDSVRQAALQAFEARAKAHEAKWQDTWLENASRDAKEHAMRCWELEAWPNVVAVANAVTRSLLADPPMLFASTLQQPCPIATRPDALSKAVAAWRAQGLAAVPLCELAAVLTCLEPFK